MKLTEWACSWLGHKFECGRWKINKFYRTKPQWRRDVTCSRCGAFSHWQITLRKPLDIT